MLIERFRSAHPDLVLYERSVREKNGIRYCLARRGTDLLLGTGGAEMSFRPADGAAAALLRREFPWLAPRTCDRPDSFGFGDRLGLATPGHIRALGERPFFPVFAQQSVRELERTDRDFAGVLDAAVLACFREGWETGFGADADHVKEVRHLEAAARAGFTFFTIDPSDQIRRPDRLSAGERRTILAAHAAEFAGYEGRTWNAGGTAVACSGKDLEEFVLTYAPALDLVEECCRFLQGILPAFDLEVSVDETHLPTTPLAHILIVERLRARKVPFATLALRFPGRFEKGIDYKGSVEEFERVLAVHQGVRELLGPYRLSLHSGSDKFSVYPAFRRIAGEGIHVKTSGTSWIEAVRTVAETDFPFFRELLADALRDFARNAASYEVSADPAVVRPDGIGPADVPRLFDDPGVRQIVHISYGSILGEKDGAGRHIHRERLMETLRNHEGVYESRLAAHLGKHLALLL